MAANSDAKPITLASKQEIPENTDLSKFLWFKVSCLGGLY
jgi:hypothetical protein